MSDQAGPATSSRTMTAPHDWVAGKMSPFCQNEDYLTWLSSTAEPASRLHDGSETE